MENNQDLLSHSQKKKEKPSLKERHLTAPNIPDIEEIPETGTN